MKLAPVLVVCRVALVRWLYFLAFKHGVVDRSALGSELVDRECESALTIHTVVLKVLYWRVGVVGTGPAKLLAVILAEQTHTPFDIVWSLSTILIPAIALKFTLCCLLTNLIFAFQRRTFRCPWPLPFIFTEQLHIAISIFVAVLTLMKSSANSPVTVLRKTLPRTAAWSTVVQLYLPCSHWSTVAFSLCLR